MSYLPLTSSDRGAMLASLGLKDIEELFRSIPKSIRSKEYDLPLPASELELVNELEALAAQNRTSKTTLSFLGAGCYDHYVPAIIPHLISRGEFLTAYTPYQPEASQGLLQTIYEYQSLITALTGMDVSNASHYDGATSVAEAVLVSIHHTQRKKVLLARTLHPDYRQVIATYLKGGDGEIKEIPFDKATGSIDTAALYKELSNDVAAVVVSTPNFFGVMEDLEGLAERVHESGALFIVSSHPLSLGLFRTPREWGADFACGEGQPLGLGLNFGGPLLGYFAATNEFMRKIPGRIVGLTKDNRGQRAFVLTLQTREQHIRRERAASNICSNEALCALTASIYLSALGKCGLERIARLNLERVQYLKEKIKKLKHFSFYFSSTNFNECLIKCPTGPKKILDALRGQGIIGGLDVSSYYPEFPDGLLVCVTETKTKGDIDKFVDLLSKV
ncbi:MAG: aminomethyl-transferring glycine dehydrogenase subunit GcvPA [Candidatus Omnitrophica bacterium]|nr:aminomethyl-transferring glycine dehydrogenase subunit GcvPA [Candidatus Omnitrophota bacterium]